MQFERTTLSFLSFKIILGCIPPEQPVIESWEGGAIFRPSRPTLGPTQPPAKWVTGLSRG